MTSPTHVLNWTTVSEPVFDDPDVRLESHRNLTQVVAERAIEALRATEWLPPDTKLAAIPGWGIMEAIDQLNLPGVSHVAVSDELAPYGLYGIECTYGASGVVEVYVLDRGVELTPLASRCTPWRDVFATPFDQYADRAGQPFKVFAVAARADDDHDQEVLPMYRIRFADGDEIEAWPEEVLQDAPVNTGAGSST